MCPARGCVLAVLKLANTVSVDPVPSVGPGPCFSGRGLDAARQTLVRLGMPKGEGFGRVDSARMVGPLETTPSKGTRDSTEEREETVTTVVSPTGSAGTLRDTSPRGKHRLRPDPTGALSIPRPRDVRSPRQCPVAGRRCPVPRLLLSARQGPTGLLLPVGPCRLSSP